MIVPAMPVPARHPDDGDPRPGHDDTIYAIRLRTTDPDADDWTSDFVRDIDHIAEWVRDDERMHFRATPADLVFRGVRVVRAARSFEADEPEDRKGDPDTRRKRRPGCDSPETEQGSRAR